jgi:hypothetical protein
MTGLGDLSAKHASEENLLKRIEALESLVDDLQRRKSPVRNLEDLSNDAGLLEAGEFRSGNGAEPGSGFTGLRMGYPGFTYGADTWHIAGVNDDDLQVGISATDGKFYAAGGDVIIDDGGISLGNFNSSILKFEDTDGNFTPRIYSSAITDALVLWMSKEGPHNGIRFLLNVSEADGSGSPASIYSGIREVTAGLVEFYVASGGDDGGQIRLGTSSKWRSEDDGSGTGGYNYFEMDENSNALPEDLASSAEGRWYFRGNKFVVQWNDGGTYRYHTLDLQDGAPSFFTRSTSAPSDTIAGFLGLGEPTTLTIASGAVTATRSHHAIDTESAASTDNLDTINGGVDGDILVLKSVTGSRDTTLRDGNDNLKLAGNFTLTSSFDRIGLIYRSGNWVELFRSNNN